MPFSVLLIALSGTLAGVVSMLVYWAVSPQSRLMEIKSRAAQARAELRRAEGEDLGAVWALSKRALTLALRQIGLTAGPTALAGGLVLASAWAADSLFDLSSPSIASAGPGWLMSGHVAFWAPLCLAALAVKLRFHIQ